MCCFKLEIPFRGTVSIVDQHQVRIVLQAFALFLHRLPILLNKLRKHKFEQARSERNPAEDVPCRNHINAAMVAGDGRDRGQAGEPVFAGMDGFKAQVGQDEINGRGDRIGVGIEPQQFVRRAV